MSHFSRRNCQYCAKPIPKKAMGYMGFIEGYEDLYLYCSRQHAKDHLAAYEKLDTYPVGYITYEPN